MCLDKISPTIVETIVPRVDPKTDAEITAKSLCALGMARVWDYEGVVSSITDAYDELDCLGHGFVEGSFEKFVIPQVATSYSGAHNRPDSKGHTLHSVIGAYNAYHPSAFRTIAFATGVWNEYSKSDRVYGYSDVANVGLVEGYHGSTYVPEPLAAIAVKGVDGSFANFKGLPYDQESSKNLRQRIERVLPLFKPNQLSSFKHFKSDYEPVHAEFEVLPMTPIMLGVLAMQSVISGSSDSNGDIVRFGSLPRMTISKRRSLIGCGKLSRNTLVYDQERGVAKGRAGIGIVIVKRFVRSA